MSYALIVESIEVKSGAKGYPILTQAGDQFIVTEDAGRWVEATSSQYRKGSILPRDTKIFGSYEDVHEFMKRWGGHPFWCKPMAYYAIEIQPVYEPRLIGYAPPNEEEQYEKHQC